MKKKGDVSILVVGFYALIGMAIIILIWYLGAKFIGLSSGEASSLNSLVSKVNDLGTSTNNLKSDTQVLELSPDTLFWAATKESDLTKSIPECQGKTCFCICKKGACDDKKSRTCIPSDADILGIDTKGDVDPNGLSFKGTFSIRIEKSNRPGLLGLCLASQDNCLNKVEEGTITFCDGLQTKGAYACLTETKDTREGFGCQPFGNLKIENGKLASSDGCESCYAAGIGGCENIENGLCAYASQNNLKVCGYSCTFDGKDCIAKT